MKTLICILCCLFGNQLTAQQVKINNTMKKYNGPAPKKNIFFQFGVADAFIGGVFEGTFTMDKLLVQGDFGIGAPSLLDGELTVYQGKAYQTQSSDKTVEVPRNFTTALAFVTYFKTDTTFTLTADANEKTLYAEIDKYLLKKNAMYAIKISGNFASLTTRAFPKYTTKPYPPLATLIATQSFFKMTNTAGVLVGYKLPAYMNGLSIEGYHFHFLSADQTKGGHLLNFTGNGLTVEIAELRGLNLVTGNDKSFMDYNFKKIQNTDLDKVEKGH